MRIFRIHVVATVTLILSLLLPLSMAFAQLGTDNTGTPPGDNSGTPVLDNSGTPQKNDKASSQSVSNDPCGHGGGGLQNPLSSCTVTEFLMKIVDVLLIFALPIIILFIMYGGFLLVTAQGEPAKLETGRNAILWAVIGGVVVLGVKLILDVIQGTVDQLTL